MSVTARRHAAEATISPSHRSRSPDAGNPVYHRFSYVSSAETPGFNRGRKRVNPASFQSFRVRPITYCRSRSVNGIRVTPENVDR